MENKGFVIGSSMAVAANQNIFGVGATINTDPDTIALAHQLGLYVMMWGLKTDEGNKTAIRLSPDIVQTDKPIPMLMLFNRFNFEYEIP
jgi:glycerophosphoryl diester phosphodiesterase